MKKENFVSLILGVAGALVLGIGMCMAMLPEWNAAYPVCAALTKRECKRLAPEIMRLSDELVRHE